MKKIVITLITLVIAFAMQAQTNNTFFLGHSLINFDVPNIVNKLSVAGNQFFSYDANIGNGANLQWQWNNPTTAQGSIWNTTLPLGGYENFIITEAVPLQNHLLYSETYRYADSFYSFANQYNPNIQYYLYETWHCTNSGDTSISAGGGYPCDWDPGSTTPWRARLTQDLSKWESIADSMNLIHTNPMLIIPGGQAMARLSDSIDNNAIPGLASITDLFTDEYHLDNRGNYFIGCVMYSVIHGASPVGLPNQLTNQYNVLYTNYPTPAQATQMQEIAWQTVCDYPRSGVNCVNVPLGIKDFDQTNNTRSSAEQNKKIVAIYPNPAKDQIKIECSERVLSITLYDIYGQQIIKQGVDIKALDISQLLNGMYFVKVQTSYGAELHNFLKR